MGLYSPQLRKVRAKASAKAHAEAAKARALREGEVAALWRRVRDFLPLKYLNSYARRARP